MKHKIYWHVPSFLNIDMAQVVEIFAYGYKGPVCPVHPIPWLLMTWGCTEPVHQQPWY